MISNHRNHINIGIVGVGVFGQGFVPIYQHHPQVNTVSICDRDESRLQEIGDSFRIEKRFRDMEAMLADPDIHAVHILTDQPMHADHAVAVLQANKHCACAVPMAQTLKDLWRVIAAQRQSGKNYMMMETDVFSDQFFFVQDLYERGEMGKITFMEGYHFQDLEGAKRDGKQVVAAPPMHYATHAVSPLLALLKTRATKVHCFGSGTLRQENGGSAVNPFPFETAIFRLEDSDVVADIKRFWYQTTRQFGEGFNIYGEKMGFEWKWLDKDSEDYAYGRQMAPTIDHLLLKRSSDLSPINRGFITNAERIVVPHRDDLLPEEIRRFKYVHNPWDHGGSHPHMIHEFISSIVENRKPSVDEIRSADFSAAGICAHESALKDGKCVDIPDFRE